MGVVGLLIMIVGAVVLGFAAQAIGTARTSYDWLITAVAAAVGAFLASEVLGIAPGVLGPEFDGLYLLPALIGAIVLGAIVEYVFRVTGRPATSV